MLFFGEAHSVFGTGGGAGARFVGLPGLMARFPPAWLGFGDAEWARLDGICMAACGIQKGQDPTLLGSPLLSVPQMWAAG